MWGRLLTADFFEKILGKLKPFSAVIVYISEESNRETLLKERGMEHKTEWLSGLGEHVRRGHMEDSAILALYWDRAEEAVTFTKEKYGALCRSVARRLLNDERDVDECENDVYVRAWNSIPPERPVCLSAWLARVARNAALDRSKYNGAACRNSALAEAFEELEPWLVAAEGDPQKALDEKEFRQMLNDFLREQSPEARRFFLRRYWYGETVREIAQGCGVKEAKVKTSLFRTKERLRTQLESEGIKL